MSFLIAVSGQGHAGEDHAPPDQAPESPAQVVVEPIGQRALQGFGQGVDILIGQGTLAALFVGVDGGVVVLDAGHGSAAFAAPHATWMSIYLSLIG